MRTHSRLTRPAPDERSGERGAALALVIMILLGISALATTMIIMGQADHRLSANERDSERALFASKSGLSYGFYLFQEELLTPTSGGTTYNSFASEIATPLEGAEFTATIFSMSAAQGQLYRIESTGSFGTASRTTELLFQVVSDAFRFGYMGFDDVTLHNHSGVPANTFKIESTVFSNGSVGVPEDITLDGAVVATGSVSISSGATIKRSVFANEVSNGGTIEGNVELLTSVSQLSSDAGSWDRLDANGNKFAWFDGQNSPGSYGGGGTLLGTSSSYTVQNGDEFKSSLFTEEGNLILDPDVNVIQYVAPPTIDYPAMKEEADLNDPTYFETAEALYTYLASKRVTETIDGKTVTTIRAGTVDAPEWLYVREDVSLDLVTAAEGDSINGGEIVADGMVLEGGLYVAGSFEVHTQEYDSTLHPAPPLYYGLHINALDYCFPAIVAYEEPGSGTISSWTQDDTPPAGGGGSFKMSSTGDHEGFVLLNGLTYSQADTHMHHTAGSDELIRFNGAELAWKIHNCDYFQFTYDPDVKCTRFLGGAGGTPGVVSYREIRQ